MWHGCRMINSLWEVNIQTRENREHDSAGGQGLYKKPGSMRVIQRVAFQMLTWLHILESLENKTKRMPL